MTIRDINWNLIRMKLNKKVPKDVRDLCKQLLYDLKNRAITKREAAIWAECMADDKRIPNDHREWLRTFFKREGK